MNDKESKPSPRRLAAATLCYAMICCAVVCALRTQNPKKRRLLTNHPQLPSHPLIDPSWFAQAFINRLGKLAITRLLRRRDLHTPVDTDPALPPLRSIVPPSATRQTRHNLFLGVTPAPTTTTTATALPTPPILIRRRTPIHTPDRRCRRALVLAQPQLLKRLIAGILHGAEVGTQTRRLPAAAAGGHVVGRLHARQRHHVPHQRLQGRHARCCDADADLHGRPDRDVRGAEEEVAFVFFDCPEVGHAHYGCCAAAVPRGEVISDVVFVGSLDLMCDWSGLADEDVRCE